VKGGRVGYQSPFALGDALLADRLNSIARQGGLFCESTIRRGWSSGSTLGAAGLGTDHG